MTLVVYNTLTKRKEEFKPLHANTVNMYVCGVTPYDELHLGHGRCYVAFDVIKRYLEYKGYHVNHVQNFTDIDDKIIRRAQEWNIAPLELSQKNIDEYFKDIDLLNVKRAKAYPKVTEYISRIVSFVETLVRRGDAYVIAGDVYFRVARFYKYGKLSHRDLNQLKAGARVEVDERKEDPLDFALWKKEKPGEPSWPSPWGNGRPGWHIECSVMSLSAFAVETLDIHGGGQDLIFPHHENELAQSESYTGKPFVKYWLHNGFVTIDKEKMSKSLGNFFTLKQIYQKYPPAVLRFFLVSQHYRHPIDFSEDKLEEMRKAYDKFTTCLKLVEDMLEHVGEKVRLNEKIAVPVEVAEFENRFTAAMDDDFNTAEALAGLYEIVSVIHHLLEQKEQDIIKVSYMAKTLIKLGQVLGLFSSTVTSVKKGDKALAAKGITKEEIERLIALRNEYRQKKQWAESDKVRDELLSKGIVLEDTVHGTRWKVKDIV